MRRRLIPLFALTAATLGSVFVGSAHAETATINVVTASMALVQRIIDNPQNYYVNVHNVPFPGGAVRGQLA